MAFKKSLLSITLSLVLSSLVIPPSLAREVDQERATLSSDAKSEADRHIPIYRDSKESIEILEKAADQNYLPAVKELYSYYSRKFNNDQFKAYRYLFQGAGLNDYDLTLTLANKHRDDQPLGDHKASYKMGNTIYRQLIVDHPEKVDARIEFLKGLSREGRWGDYIVSFNLRNSKSAAEIASNIAFLENATILDVELRKDSYLLTGLFYGSSSPYQNYQKAYDAYEKLSDLGKEYNNKYYPQFARFKQAELLKVGDKSLAKDEKRAFKMLLEADELLDEIIINDYLGEMYHYGLGTKVNLDKAIEYYLKGTDKINLTLGSLLLDKDDEKSQARGINIIVNHLSNYRRESYPQVQALEERLLAYPEHPAVSRLMYRVHHYSNYYDNIGAYHYLEKQAKAGIYPAQYQWALLQMESKYQEHQLEGRSIINQLVANGYLPAIEYRLEKSRDPYEQKQLLDLLLPETSSDEKFLKIGDQYRKLGYYNEALIAYQKIKTPHVSYFESYYIDGTKKQQAELEALIREGKEGSEEAVLALIDIYQKQGDFENTIKWSAKGRELKNLNITRFYADSLLYEKDHSAEDQALAKKLYIESIANGEEHQYEFFYKAYITGRLEIEDEEFLALIKAKYPDKHQQIAKQQEGIKERLIILSQLEKGEFKPSKESDPQEVLHKLVHDFESQESVPKDEKIVLRALKQLAQLGDKTSAEKLGDFYLEQSENDADLEEAISWYKMATKEEDSPKKVVEIYDKYWQASKNGEPEAQFTLGKYYLNDFPFSKKLSYHNQGWELIENAAENDWIEAQIYLAKQRYLSQNITPVRDDALGEKWLNRAIALGSEDAKAYMLTHLYERLAYLNNPEDRAEIKRLLLEFYEKEKQAKKIPLSNSYYSDLLRLYIQEGNVDLAEEIYLEALEYLNDLTQESSLEYLEDAYANRGNYRKALEFAKERYALETGRGLGAGYAIASYYLEGDKTLAKDEAKAIEWYQKIYQKALVRPEVNYIRGPYSYESELNKLAPYIEWILRGSNGMTRSEKNQNLAEAWLVEMAERGSQRANEILYSYYLDQSQFAEAYFYGQLIEAKELERVSSQLKEQKKSSIDREVEARQKSLVFAPYQAELEYLIKNSQREGGYGYYNLGVAYYEGVIVEKDLKLAIEYLERAGKEGLARGYHYLGNLFAKTENGIRQDLEKMVYYLDLGAKGGNNNSAHQLGDIYYFGKTAIEKDYAKAVAYFEMVDLSRPSNRHFNSKYKAAYILYHGLGDHPVDKARALALLESIRSYNNTYVNKALETWDFTK